MYLLFPFNNPKVPQDEMDQLNNQLTHYLMKVLPYELVEMISNILREEEDDKEAWFEQVNEYHLRRNYECDYEYDWE